jgi:ABC-type transport system involved in cytochrome c biogenesis permease subunit
MNEENIKLQRVQRSCKVAGIVSRILFIFTMVASVLVLLTGILMIANRESLDKQILESAKQGQNVKANGRVDLKLGPVQFASVTQEDLDNGRAASAVAGDLTSDIPALQTFFDENKDSISTVYGLYCIGMFFPIAILTFALFFIHSAFNVIKKEGNPFADKALKKILVSMIAISVTLAFTAGVGSGVLGGFLTWVIYTILDYGRTLKIQADETL